MTATLLSHSIQPRTYDYESYHKAGKHFSQDPLNISLWRHSAWNTYFIVQHDVLLDVLRVYSKPCFCKSRYTFSGITFPSASSIWTTPPSSVLAFFLSVWILSQSFTASSMPVI